MKQDSTSTSEFMEQQVVETSSVFTDFSTIAARGHNVISRARRNGRWWVLKSLEEKVRNTEPFVSMLRKEFDIMASLQDPNIVNVVSIEEVDKLGLSIVMEWIDGVTLGEWLKEPHSKKEKLRVLHQLITTLAYVHQHQTAHRDLKPSNVMVTHRGNNVKLIDFGLSDTDSFDYMKVPAGTVGYRAPEVEAVEAVEASATINYQRADIYSLGRIIEDFHLGSWSNPVVQRACGSLDSRFHNVEEVAEKLLLAEKMFFWRWIAVVLFGICTIVLGGGWVRQQFPEWSAPENAATKTLENGRNLLGTGEKKETGGKETNNSQQSENISQYSPTSTSQSSVPFLSASHSASQNSPNSSPSARTASQSSASTVKSSSTQTTASKTAPNAGLGWGNDASRTALEHGKRLIDDNAKEMQTLMQDPDWNTDEGYMRLNKKMDGVMDTYYAKIKKFAYEQPFDETTQNAIYAELMFYSMNHHSNHWMAQLKKYYEAYSLRKKGTK